MDSFDCSFRRSHREGIMFKKHLKVDENEFL